MPFEIALKDVPDDFVHGPFCSVDSGTGTLAVSVEEDLPIEWEIAGPGCVQRRAAAGLTRGSGAMPHNSPLGSTHMQV